MTDKLSGTSACCIPPCTCCPATRRCSGGMLLLLAHVLSSRLEHKMLQQQACSWPESALVHKALRGCLRLHSRLLLRLLLPSKGRNFSPKHDAAPGFCKTEANAALRTFKP